MYSHFWSSIGLDILACIRYSRRHIRERRFAGSLWDGRYSMMPPMSGPRIGQRFGSFELIEFLGRGGFAEVYLGQNMRLHNQKAAIKILEKERVLQNSEAFEKEAGIIATLSH